MNEGRLLFHLIFRELFELEGKPGIHIGDLWVSPAIRGQGIGSALLRHIPLSE